MSEVKDDLKEMDARKDSDQDKASPDHVKSYNRETSKRDLEGCLLDAHPSSADVSPSLSSEATGLLSLPVEMVTHIVSHLPAQCIINVLPKVCHALVDVGMDSNALQIRARRLIGSSVRFPVGPKEDFDWAAACLELEPLITCWSDQAQLVARQIQEEEERERARQQQRAGQDDEPAAEIPENGGVDVVDGVGVAGQEVAYGVDEGMEVALEGEDGEMQPIVDGDQMEEDAVALMEGERDHRVVHDEGRGNANHQENLADPHLDNERQAQVEHQPARSPSPPPALERITLPSGHIAQINSVLLVGGEGKVCATGSRDWNVKLWDLQANSNNILLYTLGTRGNFSTHRGWVWCLASQGPLLVSGGFDSTVKLWDLQAGGAERRVIRAGAAVLCLSCQTDMLLAGTFDKKVNMYDIRAAEPLVKSVRLHGNAVMTLAADDKYIISGSKDCSVSVYDRRAGKALKKIQLNTYMLSMSYNDSEMWSGDNKGKLHSFSMQSGILKPLSQFDVGHTALLTGIHRSAGSLYTCSSDRTVKVHIPCAPPRTLCTLQHQAGVNSLSVEAGVLAVASGDMYAEVWRPRN